MSEILRDGPAGPAFKLRGDWTVASVRESAAQFHRRRLEAEAGRKGHGLSRRCRKGRHRTEVIGDVFTGDKDTHWQQQALLVIASTDTEALVRCKDCGAVKRRNRRML